uniref:G-protein coupled receptors family 1 profile domain-containing protein n=1 Tax=Sparus aurata TaxID=8175 RepID=A0A671Z0N1_SPAAU
RQSAIDCLNRAHWVQLLEVVKSSDLFIALNHLTTPNGSPTLHSPTNLLILSLAFSDFFMGLYMFLSIMLVDGCWFLGDLMCTLYDYLGYVIASASVGTMVLISVDRYVAICYPMHYYSEITQKRVQVCICLCWICSVIFQSLILKDARAMRSHIAAATQSGKVTAKKSEMKAARTLGVVVVLFLICLSPYYCVALTGQENLRNYLSAAFVFWLYYFNSCLNPMVYAFCYPWLRKSIKLIVTFKILQPDSSELNIL